MAGTSTSFTPNLIGSSSVELTKANRTGDPFSVRISTRSNGISTTCDDRAEGPYCIYVGPIETASKETLEALYLQARDAYYSGKPLIVDDMFDRVELKLRWYGSKSVVKYPRCSLRRQSTYADAEVFTLGSIWILFLAVGSSACLVPILYTVSVAYQNAFNPGSSYGIQASAIEFLATLNSILFMTLGWVTGYPVALAAVKVLGGLWRNGLVALKGPCPNCGEEVFAFVRADRANDSPHRANCHVCESLLEFRTKKIEQPISTLGRQGVYGRIYLVSRRRKNHCQRLQ